MKKILLVSTHINSPAVPGRAAVLSILENYLDGLDADVSTVMFEDLTYSIKDNKTLITMPGNIDVASYDLVYIKNWRAVETAATALAVYLQTKGSRILCEELLHFRVTDKISEAFVLSCNGVPYPDTVFTVYSSNLPVAVEQNSGFTYPLVAKAVDGSAGSDNYLVDSREDLEKIVNENPKLQFMVQNMIDNDGDHRILMMGFEPKLSFKRSRADDSTHLNNTSQGATAVLTKPEDYSKEILEDCVKASKLVRREIAGVDILIDKHTGRHVVLEVNASPQLSSGAYLEEKRSMIRDFFEMELAK